VGEECFRRVENREVVMIQGEPLPCFRLGLVLGLPEQSDDKVAGILPRAMGASRRPGRTLVVLSTGETPLALEVDGVENEQEILLKPLGPQLVRVRFVAGATVLGSGAVVPVLNPSDLIQAALKNAPLSRFSPEEEAPRERPAVLVAEDSITSRTLIKNILTTAGYDVTAVVDGAAAWEALGEKDYAALVSDVEMPRMNGFELTARVRGEPRWAEIPVVLITSLESREDRERGAEAGANAYIVKSSFDQGNLLDVLGRLI
jgi:two-component system chemotaxis sensor kinase CheA